MKTIYAQDNLTQLLNQYRHVKHLTVYLKAQDYYEKLVIYRDNLTIIGVPGKSRIYFDDYAKKINPVDLGTTFRSSSVCVLGHKVTFVDCIIENTAGLASEVHQAVALSVYGKHFKMIRGRILGHQDTLFLGPLPRDLISRYRSYLLPGQLKPSPTLSIFTQTNIEGSVDFIFGSGTAIFDRCQINLRQKGYLCAPSHYPNTKYGFIFYRCRIESLNADQSLLGRPWRNYGKAYFLENNFQAHLDKRFDSWEKAHFFFYELPFYDDPLSQAISLVQAHKLHRLVAKKIKSLSSTQF
ncbi:MAG: hypothetical protein LBV55_04505 [Acholeplasmatales bacterium]|nr:hypothetical protein [Acholeplasmatales bacterium]